MTKQICSANNFEVRGFKFDAHEEELRAPRIIRVAAIQHSIVLPTTAELNAQRDALLTKIADLIRAAAASHANIICLAETWSRFDQKSFIRVRNFSMMNSMIGIHYTDMPFGLATQEMKPWVDFAEHAENGPTTQFLMKVTKCNLM